MKTCAKCKQDKLETEFSRGPAAKDGLNARCKKCRAANGRERYSKNSAAHCERTKKYYEANREHFAIQRKRKRQKDGEGVRRYFRERMREQRKEIGFRLLATLRARLYQAVRRGRGVSESTKELLGCSMEQLRAHLESGFRAGMTWGNYGSFWEIDHKRPCASFDFTDPAQRRECFHWTNLQALTSFENASKGKRWG